MIAALRRRLRRPVTFVVGKGGVGKTTTAGALALALADDGARVHLLSTDPAHSLGDLFLQPLGPRPEPSGCTDGLVLEELDAGAVARTRLDALRPALLELVDRGTYLDPDDARSLLEAAVPGLDELGAALRLVELVGEADRLVVDTAPAGHTLRLLDMATTVRSWATAFRAMAAKADAVASALVGRQVRLSAEAELDALAAEMDRFDDLVRAADFVVVTGPGDVIRAGTGRLLASLEERGLDVAATVASARPGARADVLIPVRPGLAGCERLREVAIDGAEGAEGAEAVAAVAEAVADRGSPASRAVPPPLDRALVVFAGKGGVGKTTCAAALAVRRAADGPVVLMGADPAGSLADVVAGPVPGLTLVEVDADAELERLRERYRAEVDAVFRAVGLDQGAALDREVVGSLWRLAPPGLDELVAVGRLADGVPAGSTLVLDTAPTGHFLRLVAMPELALDWVRRVMRILLKYRAGGGLDGPAESLIRLARQLRDLRQHLSDPARTAIVLVSNPEPLVAAETRRLLDRLAGLGLPAAAVLVNRADGDDTGLDSGAGVAIRSPFFPDPRGADRLLAFHDAWERVP